MPSISTSSANFSGVHLKAIFVGLTAGFKIRDTEHFSGDAKEQVVFPLNVFSCVGKGKTEGAHPVEVRRHGENIASRKDE